MSKSTKIGNKWITLTDADGTTRRYNLASMISLNISVREGAWATGVSLKNAYLMPKSKRVILETYSIWENRATHGCIGTQYHIASPETIARLYQETSDERLVALIPIGEE
ncbi:MAG: hypothetical protein PHG35_02010 [Dehalococcoidales bacterium]|nr:hypothetical protein [Dehalococcoidales bacterium]